MQVSARSPVASPPIIVVAIRITITTTHKYMKVKLGRLVCTSPNVRLPEWCLWPPQQHEKFDHSFSNVAALGKRYSRRLFFSAHPLCVHTTRTRYIADNLVCHTFDFAKTKATMLCTRQQVTKRRDMVPTRDERNGEKLLLVACTVRAKRGRHMRQNTLAFSRYVVNYH